MSLRNQLALKQIIFLKNLWVKIEIDVKIAKYGDFIILCIEFTKVVFVISKNSDWLGGQKIIPTTIGFVFGTNTLTKTFSISGVKKD